MVYASLKYNRSEIERVIQTGSWKSTCLKEDQGKRGAGRDAQAVCGRQRVLSETGI